MTSTFRKAIRFTAIAAATTVAIACYGCRNEGSGEAADAPQGLNPVALTELRKGAGKEQLEMLADGEVTFQEYEQAILSTITCISDAGITVGTPELKYQRKYYWYDWEIPGDKADELFPKLDACTGAWLPIVDAWYLEIAPTEEEISAGRRALVTCLRDAGIDIPVEATEQDFARLRSSPSPKFLKCVEKVREEFGLVGFAG
ncbi:MAG: hypothetical protein IT301_02000 [Dehalococcoidia bacterium]|nr:hypothetical protein [Dehalococcoidia bacterium]